MKVGYKVVSRWIETDERGNTTHMEAVYSAYDYPQALRRFEELVEQSHEGRRFTDLQLIKLSEN